MTTNNQHPPLSAEEWKTCEKCRTAWAHSRGLSAFCSTKHYAQFKQYEDAQRKAYATQQTAPLEERIRELELKQGFDAASIEVLATERDAAIMELGEVSRKLGKLEAECEALKAQLKLPEPPQEGG